MSFKQVHCCLCFSLSNGGGGGGLMISIFVLFIITLGRCTNGQKSFKKFYGRYQDLIEKYRRSVNAMVSDSFPGQFLFNM